MNEAMAARLVARIEELEREVVITRIQEWNRGYDSGYVQGKIDALQNDDNPCVFRTVECTGDAHMRVDPYAAELSGDDSLKMMCDACAYRRAQDI